MAKLTPASSSGVTNIGADAPSYELRLANTIGRHPDCEVCLESRRVSRRHATIKFQQNQYLLSDLDSSQGTFLNGVRLAPGAAVTVTTGDLLRFGDVALEFEESSPAVVDRPPVHTQFLEVDADGFAPLAAVQSDTVLRRDYERLRVAHELSMIVADGKDVAELAGKILARLATLLRADTGIVELYDDQQQPYLSSTYARTPGVEAGFSRTILAEVMSKRAAVLTHDAQVDPRFDSTKSIVMQGIRSSLVAPLQVDDAVFGVMALDTRVQADAFSEKDLSVMQSAANQVAVVLQNARYSEELAKEALLRARFQRLVAPNIAESIVQGELVVEREGQERDVSVVFSDIRGFTAYSEGSDPRDVVALLNDYFEEMVDILFEFGGTLDKFVGDEIMAVFGAPTGQDDHALRAVRAAVAMQRRTIALRAEWAGDGECPLKVGVGINSGTVIAGFLGSSKALDYTVIGDVVNTASRLCDEARADEVVVSQSTRDLLVESIAMSERPPIRVKGKADPLQTFSVLLG